MDIANQVQQGISFITFSAFDACKSYVNYLFGTAVDKQKHYYTVSYQYNDMEYKIRCKYSRKRINIIEIVGVKNDASEDIEVDISNEIKPYMGPHMNFHGIKTSPKEFGYRSITFTLLGGDVKKFELDEEIVL